MKIKTDWNDIVGRLDKSYELALGSGDEQGFFINLLHYISNFDSQTELQDYIKTDVIGAYKEDHAVLDILESNLVKECSRQFEEIQKYIDKNVLNIGEIIKLTTEFKGHESGKIISSNGRTFNMVFYLGRIIYAIRDLDEKKHLTLLEQFGSFDKKDNKYSLYIDAKRDLYEIEKQRIERMALTKIWYYWDKLAYIYNLYSEYEKMHKDWFDKGNFLSLMGTNDAYNELLTHLGLKKSDRNDIQMFDVDEYKRALIQFHYHLSNDLGYQKTDKITAVFDKKTNTLILGKENIKFKDGKRLSLLELVFKNKKKVYFDEALKYIEGIDTEEVVRDKDRLARLKKNFLNYCDGINTQVVKKNFPKILNFSSNRVEVSSTYVIS